MAQGNEIIVSSPALGRFEWVLIDGTPKPGTVMTVKPGSAARTSNVGNVFEYEPAGTSSGLMAADGDQIPIGVLDMDKAQGRLATDAYADGDLGRVYWPANGEFLNILFHNETGTADDVTIGMKMIVDDGSGGIIPTAGSPESEPFVAFEAYTDPTADQLILCQYTGH